MKNEVGVREGCRVRLISERQAHRPISLTGGTEPGGRSLSPEKFEGRVPPLRLTRGSGCLAGGRGPENRQDGRFSCGLAVNG